MSTTGTMTTYISFSSYFHFFSLFFIIFYNRSKHHDLCNYSAKLSFCCIIFYVQSKINACCCCAEAQCISSGLSCFWSIYVSFSLRAASLLWVPRTGDDGVFLNDGDDGEAGEKNEAPHSSRQLSVAAPHPNKWACSQAMFRSSVCRLFLWWVGFRFGNFWLRAGRVRFPCEVGELATFTRRLVDFLFSRYNPCARY